MNCYKVLFTVKGIIQNIALYINIPIIIFHIITIIMFYTNQKKNIWSNRRYSFWNKLLGIGKRGRKKKENERKI